MIRFERTFVVGVLVATMLFASGADAAWWPWKKKGEPPPEPAVTAETVDSAERLVRAEEKIRELTGLIEELAFRLHQTQQQLAALQAETDARIAELGGKPRPKAVAAAEPAPDGGVLVIAKEPDAIGSIADPAAAPAPAAARLDAAAEQPIDLGAAPAPAAPAEVASLGDPASDYERGYQGILNGDYVLAETSFRQFMAAYPGDPRAPDAQYWLGESLFARGQFREAADEFLAGYKAYPKSGKAADTLLKLGLSLAGLGERDAACSTYAEILKKYPQASKALRQRVANEQAVASCG